MKSTEKKAVSSIWNTAGIYIKKRKELDLADGYRLALVKGNCMMEVLLNE